MTRSRLAIITLVSTAYLPCAASAALAASHRCERLPADTVEVDGLLDDWAGVRARRVGGAGRDAGYAIRCGYDDARLYIAVDIRDERVIRNPRPSPRTDDHLAVALAVGDARTGRVVAFPGTDRVKPAHTFGGGRVPRWMQVADSLQPRGWSVELSLPRAKVRGLTASAPGVTARIALHDADMASERKIQDVVAWQGLLEIGDAAATYRSFLAAAGLRAGDIELDVMADVDGAKGAERVVAGGKVIGVISDQFAYVELPVASAADVLKVEVVRLRDDGTSSILAHYRQRGNGGSRDVVSVWNPDGVGRFTRLLAFEVRKQLGDRVLVNRWRLVPRGKHRGVRARGRGADILVEVSDRDVKGWDEDSYHEQPAPDVRPILLPWSDQTSAVYYFEGNVALGGDPARGR